MLPFVFELLHSEKVKVSNNDKSHNSYKEFKRESRAKAVIGHYRGGIKCVRGESILCLTITTTMSFIS